MPPLPGANTTSTAIRGGRGVIDGVLVEVGVRLGERVIVGVGDAVLLVEAVVVPEMVAEPVGDGDTELLVVAEDDAVLLAVPETLLVGDAEFVADAVGVSLLLGLLVVVADDDSLLLAVADTLLDAVGDIEFEADEIGRAHV